MIKIRAVLLSIAVVPHYTWKTLVCTRGLVAPIYTGAASQANTTGLFGATLACNYFPC